MLRLAVWTHVRQREVSALGMMILRAVFEVSFCDDVDKLLIQKQAVTSFVLSEASIYQQGSLPAVP